MLFYPHFATSQSYFLVCSFSILPTWCWNRRSIKVALKWSPIGLDSWGCGGYGSRSGWSNARRREGHLASHPGQRPRQRLVWNGARPASGPGDQSGVGGNLLTSADCTKTGLVVVRGGLQKLFVLSKGQRAVWWPRPMSGFSRMDVVTCTVVHKPAGQRRRRNQLNSKFSFWVRFSNKSKGTTNIWFRLKTLLEFDTNAMLCGILLLTRQINKSLTATL